MSTKFFNNTGDNTLFERLKGIANTMATFERFLAVVGYFRSSGYFKLRKELGDVSEVKILVGINLDDVFRGHSETLWELSDNSAEAKKIYEAGFKQDILDAKYDPEIEAGILQMCDDLSSGRLEIRMHNSRNLHAKFYLCLPASHTQYSDGWVIMGSSNISDSGLGITEAPRYELNVAMKDFDDVDYCHNEFKKLWESSVPISASDINQYKSETYLGGQPTPYELYIKVLIDTFGDQVEDDFDIELPEGVKDLKYQKDAVIQGYQMLLQHNGLFLADVVGLGKTNIATMIAKRFIEANGKNTNILVIYPPALESNWRDAFRLFGISKQAQFISNGSLSKVIDGKDQYRDKEEFDLIIVDESHGFRNDGSGKYGFLQRICKAPCSGNGLLHSTRKRVMLLSATPLNNSPEDLLNQLLLFQDGQKCTIDGVPNLNAFFAPKIEHYKKLMKERDRRDITSEVDNIYDEIRERVIDKVTVRRTRSNILNDPDYRADIEAQGIKFPHIEPPIDLEYKMSPETSKRFYNTLAALSDEDNDPHLYYARYRAVEFLKPEFQSRYTNAETTGQSLAGLYRVHMVKRLESSFYAFKRSLAALLSTTSDMIEMFEADSVVIIPDVKVSDLLSKGMELDEIIEYAQKKKGLSAEDIQYSAADFDPDFLTMLRHDRAVLEMLNNDWAQESEDPKFDEFTSEMNGVILDPATNPSGKFVLFSESVDTLEYLYDRLTRDCSRTDVMLVTSQNRSEKQQAVKNNFDANAPVHSDDYNILLTSDVLSEGINLHRSNVIVNYDSPWNATRLMQRIGRVNRIGSTADSIYNYLFYPSQQGDKEIQLYKNALIKLQSFHSAYGEDSQIYSREEIVKQFTIFDSSVRDTVDRKIQLLREVRALYSSDRKLYHKIKNLPMKSRVMRDEGANHPAGSTLVYISSDVKTEFYLVSDTQCRALDLLEAVKYLKAEPGEQPVPFTSDTHHYDHINCALRQYATEYIDASDTNVAARSDLSPTAKKAIRLLRQIQRLRPDNSQLDYGCTMLTSLIDLGTYNQLPQNINNILRTRQDDVEGMIADVISLAQTYGGSTSHSDAKHTSEPRIIISESFK